ANWRTRLHTRCDQTRGTLRCRQPLSHPNFKEGSPRRQPVSRTLLDTGRSLFESCPAREVNADPEWEGHMRIAEMSRRSFVKTALAGAAGTLMPRITAAGDEARAVANSANLSALSLSQASQLVHSKKISPVELTQACLGRIEQLNAKLNAIITVTADSAL